ncbi:MAG: WhiB family transcriptional regulator [Acidimicrobiales bacterium]
MLAERLFEDKTELGAEALCSDGTGDLVALFFSEQLDDIGRAKAICAECPVRQDCFEGALARREPYGVWGGHLFFKGKVLAMKRPRGRPPKHPRPLSAESA